MAGGMDLGSTKPGGKKPLDAPINLVPFIDLMAVTISFLIMTAVWNQAGRLALRQPGEGAEGAADEAPPLVLQIGAQTLRLRQGVAMIGPMPVARDARGRLQLGALQDALAKLKRPDSSAINLEADDGVRYDDLVRIIDTCIGDGLTSVQVSGAEG